MTPELSFVELMQAIFAHLDVHRAGVWTPEMYSMFLDAQGYQVQHNICGSSNLRQVLCVSPGHG